MKVFDGCCGYRRLGQRTPGETSRHRRTWTPILLLYQNQSQNTSMGMLRTLQHFYGGECFSPSPFSLELDLHLFNSSTITRKIIKEYRGVTKAGSTSGHSDRPPSSFASLFSGARLTMPPSSSYLEPTWQRELARPIARFFWTMFHHSNW